ncbi:c-type cytochrome [Autumnicola musiva]|uniref:Cytochrome c n=1 Tax=Autumnicola musiva TaxID=3075589 RepID=A0ABU3D0L0_9FLAO|nr:cytochrome c [Zunongwangia sp. F117]MDT0675074.1 cytochrome c [Zunongwangia sp. F117]
MKSSFRRYLLLFIFAASVISCAEDSSRNYEYMPNMYHTVTYETYGEYPVFENGQEAKLPAEGSVPRGWMPYPYENTPEGFAAARANLKNPLPYTEDNLAAGKQLYTIYCAVCHGDNGDGQGILAEREKILGIPPYDDAGRNINEGTVYHVMYYGLNNMGSYASQTTITERWLIDQYVMKLKNDLQGGPEREFDQTQRGAEPARNLIPAINAEKPIIVKDNGRGVSTTSGDQENQN